MSTGVVDLFHQLAKNDFGFFQKIASVADVMTREVKTLTLDATYRDCVELLEAHAFHHIPIVDPDRGDAVGIVSDRDVLRHRPPLLGSAADPVKDNPAFEVSVTQFMTRAPISVAPDATPESALTLMLDHHIDSVLVVDGDQRPTGIVTARDF